MIVMMSQTTKFAFIIWLSSVYYYILLAALTKAGVLLFTASGIANRIWAVTILIFFINYVIRGYLHHYKYFLFILFYIALGIFNGNNINNIIADFVLLSLPLIFYEYARKRLSITRLQEFLRQYGRYITYAILVSLVLQYGFRIPFKAPDIILLFLVLLVAIVYPRRRRAVSLKVGAMLFLAYLQMGKIFVVQLASLPLLLPKRKVLRLGFLTIVLAGGLLLTKNLWIERPNIQRGLALIESIRPENIYAVAATAYNPVIVYSYLDWSTARRISEFISVWEDLRNSGLSLMIGNGLGGTVEIIRGVDMAYGNFTELRYLHLAISFILNKFGIVGLFISLMLLARLFRLYRRGAKKIKTYYPHNYYAYITIAYYLVFLIIGALFTFSNFVKIPMIGVVLYILTAAACLPETFKGEGTWRSTN